MEKFLYAALGSGVLALAFAAWKTSWIHKQDPGTERMQEIGGSVREGAMAFLKREYLYIPLFREELLRTWRLPPHASEKTPWPRGS